MELFDIYNKRSFIKSFVSFAKSEDLQNSEQ